MSELIIRFIFFTLIVVYCFYSVRRFERIFVKSGKLQDKINENTVKAFSQILTIIEESNRRITELGKNKIMNYGSRN